MTDLAISPESGPTHHRRYWCFLSYRHNDNKQEGRQWATWLHQAIETYEVPHDLVGTKNERGEEIPARIFPVFRDEEELPADADLSAPIVRALENSTHLVVLCSPGAVASRFVSDEIRRFKAMGRHDRVIAAIISGKPNASRDPSKQATDHECFPDPLRYEVDADGVISGKPAEPVAADFRLEDGNEGWTSSETYRESLKICGLSASEINIRADAFSKRLTLMKLKVIAGILGVPLGILTKRDQAYQLDQARNRARNLRRWLTAVAMLGLLAMAGGFMAWVKQREAVHQRDVAQKSEAAAQSARNTAEGLINSMLYDLRDKLEPLGRLDLLKDVSREAERFYEGRSRTEMSTDVLRNMGTMYEGRGSILLASGDLKAARQAFEKSFSVSQQLARMDLTNDKAMSEAIQRDLAVGLSHLGDIAQAEGNLSAARQAYEASLDIRIRLASTDHGDTQFRSDVAMIYERLGTVALEQGDLKYARQEHEKALEIRQAVANANPTNTKAQRDLAISQEWISTVAQSEGDLKTARDACESSLEIRRRLAQADPSEAEARSEYCTSLTRLGDVARASGDVKYARDAYEKALDIRQRLAQADPINADAQRGLSVCYDRLGTVARMEGNLVTARQAIENSLAISRKLTQADPSNSKWQRDVAEGYSQLGGISQAEHELNAARDAYEKSLEIRQRLAQEDPTNARAQRDLASDYEQLGMVAMLGNDLAAAQQAFEIDLEISERAASMSQSNWQAQRDLAFSYGWLGIVLKMKGDLKSALGIFSREHEIWKGLVAAFPDQPTMMISLGIACLREAELLYALEPDSTSAARKSILLEGAASLQKLRDAGKLPSNHQPTLEALIAELKKFE